MICLRTSTFSFTHPPIRLRDRYRFHVYGKSKFISRQKRLESNLSISFGKSKAMESSAKASSSIMLTSGASGRVNAILSMRALKSLLTLLNGFILLLLLPFRGRKSVSISSGLEKPSKDENQERKSTVVRVPATIVPWRSSTAAGANVGAVDQEVAARRTIAIWRVMQDKDKDKSVREFSMFMSSRGETLFTQSWTPTSKKIRGLVLVMHGLNEHSGRYSDFAKQLNANGYKVHGMDWIELNFPNQMLSRVKRMKLLFLGHGGSDGLHGYVPSLDYAVNDLKHYLQKVLADNPGLPCFCFGHSTGAAIILKAVLDPKVAACVSGVALTSPAVGVQPSHPVIAVLAPVISFLMPRYQLSAANKEGAVVSRDPDALVAKYSDPLVYTGAIRVRTGYEILRITSYLQQNLRRLMVPFLVLHGTADTVTDPEASQKLYEEASSTDKTLKLLDGLLHDLLFEPEGEEIMQDIIEWINGRVESC